MSDAISNLGVLHNNAFILSPLFPNFFEEVGAKDNGFLLAYLLLPLVLPPAPRKFLVNAKSTSSLLTFLGKPGKRENVFGLEERIAEYRRLTHTCVQCMVDNEVLEVDSRLRVRVLSKMRNESLCPGNSPRAAKRLGVLLAPFDVPTIYRMVGVKSL